MLSSFTQERDAVAARIQEQAGAVFSAHQSLYDAIQHADVERFQAISDSLAPINGIAVEIDNALVRILARFSPEGNELRRLVVYLKVINNIVRVSDNIKSICRRLIKMEAEGAELAPLKPMVEQMYRCVLEALGLATEHLDADPVTIDVETIYRNVTEKEACSDEELKRLEEKIICDTNCNTSGEKSVPLAKIDLIHLVRKLERTGDRAVDIARLICYAKKGGMIESF